MITSITFNQLESLRNIFHKHYNDYEYILSTKLNDIFSNGAKIKYSTLLNDTYGAFPMDIFNMATDVQRNQIIFNPESYEEQGSDLVSLENNDEIPPPHLANFEWRFSKKSAKKIIDMLDNSLDVCCLGTPTLAIESGKRNKSVTLLDINQPIIKAISNLYTSQNNVNCFTYNVFDDLDIAIQGAFDTILMNPPWYLDYYKAFIHRSLQLLKRSGGEIIFPIFPILSRHNAINELIELQDFINTLDYVKFESLGYIDFDMPLFEKNIFERNNIPIPNKNWRKAELVRLQFKNIDIKNDFKIGITDYINWERIYNPTSKEYNLINKQIITNSYNGCHFVKDQIRTISRRKIYANQIAFWNEKNDVIILE